MHYLFAPLFPTYITYTTITTTIIPYSIFLYAYNLFCKQQYLFVAYLQTTIVLFIPNASLHKSVVVCFVLSFLVLHKQYDERFLKQNVPVLIFPRTLYLLHCCLCILFTLLVVALFISNSQIDVVVGLLIISSMYVLVCQFCLQFYIFFVHNFLMHLKSYGI